MAKKKAKKTATKKKAAKTKKRKTLKASPKRLKRSMSKGKMMGSGCSSC